MKSAYMTIPEVAGELHISKDGVYKLVKRGKLPAVRRSERGMRVSRAALDAYQRRLHQGAPEVPATRPVELDGLLADFERETGRSPQEWQGLWKADEMEDTAANMRLTIRALALLAATHDGSLVHGEDPILVGADQ
jgi:excisionase family DNA binding protein